MNHFQAIPDYRLQDLRPGGGLEGTWEADSTWARGRQALEQQPRLLIINNATDITSFSHPPQLSLCTDLEQDLLLKGRLRTIPHSISNHELTTTSETTGGTEVT